MHEEKRREKRNHAKLEATRTAEELITFFNRRINPAKKCAPKMYKTLLQQLISPRLERVFLSFSLSCMNTQTDTTGN